MLKRPAFWICVLVLLTTANVGLFFYRDIFGTSDSNFTSRATEREIVKDFTLSDISGRSHRLYDYSHTAGIVLYTHGIGCNISARSLSSLESLADRYGYTIKTTYDPSNGQNTGKDTAEGADPARAAIKQQGSKTKTKSEELSKASEKVAFFMLNSNPQDDWTELQKNIDKLGIDVPVLKDDAQLVAMSLDIDRSGEAILINPKTWEIIYRGPIDDRLDFEAQKPEASEHYLKDAIVALKDKREYSTPFIQAPGCIINLEGVRELKNRNVSYVSEVAPVLKQKCKICHKEGGIGPWQMDSFETVKGWSPMMREVIMNKRMPPWHADPRYGDFKHDLSLNTEDMKTLIAWIDAGSPRDPGTDPLTEPVAETSEWSLGKPDLVLELSEQQVPADGPIEYRNPELGIPLEKDEWVRAVEIKPSNAAVLHHAFAFIIYPEDRKSEQPEWEVGARAFFGAYVPGWRPHDFPEQSGVLMPKGSMLEFQLHYDPVGYATTDRIKIALYFHKQRPKTKFEMTSAINKKFVVPPFAMDHEVVSEYRFDEDVRLYGFYPHMHFRGRRMRYEAQYPDGSKQILLSVPAYNFNWQRAYLFKEPMQMPAGTKIVLTGAFDNSKTTRATLIPRKWSNGAFKAPMKCSLVICFTAATRKSIRMSMSGQAERAKEMSTLVGRFFAGVRSADPHGPKGVLAYGKKTPTRRSAVVSVCPGFCRSPLSG